MLLVCQSALALKDALGIDQRPLRKENMHPRSVKVSPGVNPVRVIPEGSETESNLASRRKDPQPFR